MPPRQWIVFLLFLLNWLLLLLHSCPFVEKFSLEIETYYTPDGGQLENVFNLKVLLIHSKGGYDDSGQLENVLRWMIFLKMVRVPIWAAE